MAVLGMDLGGTKLAVAVFSETGQVLAKETVAVGNRTGAAVGRLVAEQARKYLGSGGSGPVSSIGISVPGISREKSGTVWAPNIPGWEDYPLKAELEQVAPDIQVTVDSDRACYILGERWQGKAAGCQDAIFLSVGTGIGAGIMAGGSVLRGSQDIAGAIGWLALDRPFQEDYISCGCFEYHASGAGLVKVAREILDQPGDYQGELKDKPPGSLTAADVFAAYERHDAVALQVVQQAISFWGMGVANLISIFNPEIIIFGGGVFGSGLKFLAAIREEAARWAQPISMTQVRLEATGLGGDAGVYGAGFLALTHQNNLPTSSSPMYVSK